MPRNPANAFSRKKGFRDWFMRRDAVDDFLKRKTPDVFITDGTQFRRTAGFQTCLKTHAWPRTRNQA
ncbi:MAG: hypothetical protein LBC18_11515 [Opitutaceae bacterium]|jgi:hypothetical protein|nr:hypothetical protein [Opitutaceae bacterium]